MDIISFGDMIGGWFIGNFEPSAFKTDQFEVCYKKHKQNEIWDKHYHAIATEINLLVKGSMLINNTKINEGQIFILKPYEIAAPVFLEDCELVVVKTPSVIDDKYIV